MCEVAKCALLVCHSELSFRKGDYLHILRQVDKNWFFGERHGIVGIFPISYVEVRVLHIMAVCSVGRCCCAGKRPPKLRPHS